MVENHFTIPPPLRLPKFLQSHCATDAGGEKFLEATGAREERKVGALQDFFSSPFPPIRYSSPFIFYKDLHFRVLEASVSPSVSSS